MRSLFALLLICFSVNSNSQSWPNKPIRWVVPYTGGGITDVVTRVVTQKMQASMGQPIVVENKPGANSIIGHRRRARRLNGSLRAGKRPQHWVIEGNRQSDQHVKIGAPRKPPWT